MFTIWFVKNKYCGKLKEWLIFLEFLCGKKWILLKIKSYPQSGEEKNVYL